MQIAIIFMAHLFGDFILQNDWMANNKKKSSLACLAHVAAYLLPFLLCPLSWWQLILIGAQHFIQDRTMIIPWFLKITGKQQLTHPPMAPWSLIVTDNIIHLGWIMLVIQLGLHP